jgi:hypothetical protein
MRQDDRLARHVSCSTATHALQRDRPDRGHGGRRRRVRLEPESRLRNDVFLDVYWNAPRECESRYHTLHVERIGVDGSLSVSAAAESRAEAQRFRECYWDGVRERVEQRRAAGLIVPGDINLHPDIEF